MKNDKMWHLLLLLLRLLLTVPGSGEAQLGVLYLSSDPVTLLQVDTLPGPVLNSRSTWVVELFVSWCEHCISFTHTQKVKMVKSHSCLWSTPLPAPGWPSLWAPSPFSHPSHTIRVPPSHSLHPFLFSSWPTFPPCPELPAFCLPVCLPRGRPNLWEAVAFSPLQAPPTPYGFLQPTLQQCLHLAQGPLSWNSLNAVDQCWEIKGTDTLLPPPPFSAPGLANRAPHRFPQGGCLLQPVFPSPFRPPLI